MFGSCWSLQFSDVVVLDPKTAALLSRLADTFIKQFAVVGTQYRETGRKYSCAPSCKQTLVQLETITSSQASSSQPVTDAGKSLTLTF